MGKRERKRHARRRHHERKQQAAILEAKRTTPIPAGTILTDGDTPGRVTAIVAVTGNIDHDNDRIMPGAFRFPGKTAVLTEHRWDAASKLGRVIDIDEWQPGDRRLPDDLYAAGYGALVATMQFNLEKAAARDVWSDLKMDPAAWGWSIGYSPQDVADDQGVRLLKSVDVHEFSVVPFIGAAYGPANEATRTLDVKAQFETPEVKMADLTVDDLRTVVREEVASLIDERSPAPGDVPAETVEEPGSGASPAQSEPSTPMGAASTADTPTGELAVETATLADTDQDPETAADPDSDWRADAAVAIDDLARSIPG